MQLNKKYEIGSNKYIEPISIVFEKANGYCVYECLMHRSNGSVGKGEYHTLHIEKMIEMHEGKREKR